MISSLLKYRIVIEKGTNGVNAVGSPTLNYSTYMDTWAGVYVRSNDTKTTESGELYTNRTEFTIRYNSNSKNISNKFRIRYNDNYYKIVQVSEMGARDGIKIIGVAFEDGE